MTTPSWALTPSQHDDPQDTLLSDLEHHAWRTIVYRWDQWLPFLLGIWAMNTAETWDTAWAPDWTFPGIWHYVVGMAVVTLLFMALSQTGLSTRMAAARDAQRFRARLIAAGVRAGVWASRRTARWYVGSPRRVSDVAWEVPVRQLGRGQSDDVVIAAIPAIAADQGWHVYAVPTADPRAGTVTVRIVTADVLGEIVPPVPVEPATTGRVPVGIDAAAETVSIPLSHHQLIAGSSGSGKSVYLDRIIQTIIATPDTELWMIDPNRTTARPYKQDCYKIAYSPDDITTTLEDLITEMTSRFDVLDQMGADKWDRSMGPELYLVIDELAAVLDTGNKKVDGPRMSMLSQLSQQARKTGIRLICATQSPYKSVLGGQLSNNLLVRVGFRCADDVQLGLLFPDVGTPTGPSNTMLSLDRAGQGYVQAPGIDGTRLFRAYARDEDMEAAR